MHAQITHDFFNAIVGQIPVTAMQLQAGVGHVNEASVTYILAMAQNLVASGSLLSSFHAAWRKNTRADCNFTSSSANLNCRA